MSKKLNFNEKSHKYWVMNGRKREYLTSVTTFLSDFFEPFNAKEVARKLSKLPKYKAMKMGMRKILAEWKESANHGLRVHELLERHLNKQGVSYDDVERLLDYNKFLQGKAWSEEKFKDRNLQFKPEMKIHDEELGLAGTIDLPVFDYDEQVVHLYDWKTNKGEDKLKPKRVTSRTKMAKNPLEELPDCKHSVYAMQIAVYAYMLERDGYRIGELGIIHLIEDKHIEYLVDYKELKPIVEKMFEMVKNEIQN